MPSFHSAPEDIEMLNEDEPPPQTPEPQPKTPPPETAEAPETIFVLHSMLTTYQEHSFEPLLFINAIVCGMTGLIKPWTMSFMQFCA